MRGESIVKIKDGINYLSKEATNDLYKLLVDVEFPNNKQVLNYITSHITKLVNYGNLSHSIDEMVIDDQKPENIETSNIPEIDSTTTISEEKIVIEKGNSFAPEDQSTDDEFTITITNKPEKAGENEKHDEKVYITTRTPIPEGWLSYTLKIIETFGKYQIPENTLCDIKNQYSSLDYDDRNQALTLILSTLEDCPFKDQMVDIMLGLNSSEYY